MRQAIGRRAKDLVARKCPIARLVDKRLRMLDPHANRKGLGLHINPAIMRHLKGIAGRMPHRHDHMAGLQHLARGQHQPAQPARTIRRHGNVQILHPRRKAIFPAQLFNRLADRHHHRHQSKRANMRMRLGQNILGRPRFHKFDQHLAPQMARVLDAAVELAIRKRPRPALAKLHIAFRVQHRAPPQPPGVLGPLAHRLAALENNRPQTHLRQHQRGQQATRPRANHHRARPAIIRMGHHRRLVTGIGRGPHLPIPGTARQHRRLVCHHHINGINQQDRIFLAGIIAALGHGKTQQFARLQPQPGDNRRLQIYRSMVKRQFDFIYTDHKRAFIGYDTAGQTR